MDTPHFNDDHQAELKRLVDEIKSLDREDEGAYVRIIRYSLQVGIGREPLYTYLVDAGLPASTASEIGLIIDHPDLAAHCLEGMSVAEAVRLARGRKQGVTGGQHDARLLRTADRLLSLFPFDKSWQIVCGPWILRFTPNSAPEPGAGEHEA